MENIDNLTPESHTSGTSKKLPLFLPFIFLISLITIIAAYVMLSARSRLIEQNNQEAIIVPPTTSQISPANLDSFFLFEIPKPIENLTTYNLPNYDNPNNVVEIGDRLWFAGDGSIVEYDIKTNQLVSYSDAKKANCNRDIVYVADYLFASCNIDNIDDAFGTVHELDSMLYTGHYGVLKINPHTHTVEHVFSQKDGLLNGYNYQLVVDGDTIWVATFDGVGRIHARTNQVDFYTKELGFQNANRNNIGPILIDGDYVWAWNIASAKSQGGISLFDKTSNTWKAFGPQELKEYAFDRIDLESSSGGYAMKSIPGGIQIGFRDGEINGYDRFVEKQYEYETGKWTKINEQPTTGMYYEAVKEYITSNYPPTISDTTTDQYGLTQIQLAESDKTYQLDGRNNYVLSPVIENKRYILTSATVDVVDNTTPFPRIAVKLGEELGHGSYYGEPSSYYGEFLIDSTSMLALIIDPAICEGDVISCDDQKIWLIDLKEEEIKRVYTAESDNVPNNELYGELTMSIEENLLVVKDEEGKPIFNIDSKNYQFTSLID